MNSSAKSVELQLPPKPVLLTKSDLILFLAILAPAIYLVKTPFWLLSLGGVFYLGTVMGIAIERYVKLNLLWHLLRRLKEAHDKS